MIKDVEYEYKIVRTAELLVNLGDDGQAEHMQDAYEASVVYGNHMNAYLKISKADLTTAKLLVGMGLGDSVLMRMGMWRIGEYTYFTKSNKWSYKSGKTYYAKSIVDFVNKYVKRSS